MAAARKELGWLVANAGGTRRRSLSVAAGSQCRSPSPAPLTSPEQASLSTADAVARLSYGPLATNPENICEVP